MGSVKAELFFIEFDGQNRKFSLEYLDKDLEPLNNDSKTEYIDYKLAIICEHGQVSPRSSIANVRLRIRNPCLSLD